MKNNHMYKLIAAKKLFLLAVFVVIVSVAFLAAGCDDSDKLTDFNNNYSGDIKLGQSLDPDDSFGDYVLKKSLDEFTLTSKDTNESVKILAQVPSGNCSNEYRVVQIIASNEEYSMYGVSPGGSKTEAIEIFKSKGYKMQSEKNGYFSCASGHILIIITYSNDVINAVCAMII